MAFPCGWRRLFNLLALPLGAEEGDELERGGGVRQNANAPAQGRPEEPQLGRVRHQVDDRQHGDDHQVLRQVDVETADFANPREGELFGLLGLGGGCCGGGGCGCCAHVWLTGEGGEVDLEDRRQ